MTPEREAMIRKVWKEKGDRFNWEGRPRVIVPVERRLDYTFRGDPDIPIIHDRLAFEIEHGYADDHQAVRITCEGIELLIHVRQISS